MQISLYSKNIPNFIEHQADYSIILDAIIHFHAGCKG